MLSQDLGAIKEALGDGHRDPEVRGKPQVGPCLFTTIQPRHLGPAWRPGLTDEQILEEGGVLARVKSKTPCPKHSDLALALDQAAAFFAGLRAPKAPTPWACLLREISTRPKRHGLSGMPKAARQKVSAALALLEEKRPLLSFWTVTLPTEALLQIGRRDTWQLFVARLLLQLKRRLLKRLGVAVVVGVVELQPERGKSLGVPCPHLHVVFMGRRNGGSGWAIEPEELDAMIQSAAIAAGVTGDICWDTAGNVQRVKKSVRAYLSKYMTKGSQDFEHWLGSEWESLIPRQWWLRTKPMNDMITGATADLPTGFMAWVWRHRAYLEEEGFLRILQYDLPLGVPLTFRIDWASAEDLALLIARWQEQLWDDLWHARAELGIVTTPSGLLYHRPLRRDFFPVVDFELAKP